ncbi:MAG: GNAT family N-acetyltransferase [Caldilineaceae bacterium]
MTISNPAHLTLQTQGFIIRPPTVEDAQAVARLASHCWRIETNRPELGDAFSEHEIRMDWSEPGYDLTQQACLVIAPDGELVAVADQSSSAPHIKVSTWTHVHPDYYGQGIGTWLTQWHERQAGEFFRQAPDNVRLSITASIPALHLSARAVLLEHGYHHYRTFSDMKIELAGPPPTIVLPTGITISPIVEGQDEESLYRAKDEAFRDHVGWVETLFEEGFAKWLHSVRQNEYYDPALIYKAMDGDEIAGLLVGMAQDMEDPEMGWIQILAVRRPWRKRGLGLALLQHSFAEFHRRGKLRAGLMVDSESLTGATRLYERAGMRVYNRFHAYEKEVRAGMDLVRK